jgi:hypothetical protein
MPPHTDGAKGTGIGTHAPTLKYGVRSPFHAGGGGGGGACGAATHEFDGASNTVPHPHSVAWLTAGETIATYARGANTAAPTTAKRLTMVTTAALPQISPTLVRH